LRRVDKPDLIAMPILPERRTGSYYGKLEIIFTAWARGRHRSFPYSHDAINRNGGGPSKDRLAFTRCPIAEPAIEQVDGGGYRRRYYESRFIGAPPESILRLPKDGADPAYVDAYKRVAALAAPKDAAGYTFAEGTPDHIATAARARALELGLPPHVATALAANMTAAETQATAVAKGEKDIALGAQQALLRQAWGANYDANLFKANRAVEALGWDKGTLDAMQGTVGGDKLMTALLGLAGKMSEADLLRGGGRLDTPSMTRDQAIARKAEILVSAGQRQFTPVELETTKRELQTLAAIIVGPPH